MTSSAALWIWPATMWGLTTGRWVMAWRISMVCVPDVVDQLAVVLPWLAISRSSERG
jgi:hypothetical protein